MVNYTFIKVHGYILFTNQLLSYVYYTGIISTEERRHKGLLYSVPIGSSAVKSAETISSDGISKCEEGFTRVRCTGWGTGCNGGTVTALTVNWAGRRRCVSHTCPHATARVTVTGKQDKHFHPTCSDSLTRLFIRLLSATLLPVSFFNWEFQHRVEWNIIPGYLNHLLGIVWNKLWNIHTRNTGLTGCCIKQYNRLHNGNRTQCRGSGFYYFCNIILSRFFDKSIFYSTNFDFVSIFSLFKSKGNVWI